MSVEGVEEATLAGKSSRFEITATVGDIRVPLFFSDRLRANGLTVVPDGGRLLYTSGVVLPYFVVVEAERFDIVGKLLINAEAFEAPGLHDSFLSSPSLRSTPLGSALPKTPSEERTEREMDGGFGGVGYGSSPGDGEVRLPMLEIGLVISVYSLIRSLLPDLIDQTSWYVCEVI